MEYTQWDSLEYANFKTLGLNPCCNGIYSMSALEIPDALASVLILVVMEYTQWDTVETKLGGNDCLNPCCNGIYSMSTLTLFLFTHNTRLNPCCNGIYSMSGFFHNV